VDTLDGIGIDDGILSEDLQREKDFFAERDFAETIKLLEEIPRGREGVDTLDGIGIDGV
jgi:predicted metal-dependent hydrolase